MKLKKMIEKWRSHPRPLVQTDEMDKAESFEDLLLDRHLAAEQADQDLAALAEPAESRDFGGFEAGTADEEIVRESHRAINHRGSGVLSGRML